MTEDTSIRVTKKTREELGEARREYYKHGDEVSFNTFIRDLAGLETDE